jgi:uncharacterized protein YciI
MVYVLEYDLVPDYLERRAPLRPDHLALARALADVGVLRLAGALDDPAGRALLVFRDRGAAEAFAAVDPYVTRGLVRGWRVWAWNVVVGADHSDATDAPGVAS